MGEYKNPFEEALKKKNEYTNAFEEYVNYNKAKEAQSLVPKIENRVNTWLQNNKNFIANAQYRTQNRGGSSYVADSSEWLSTITTQKNNFDREAERIKGLLNQYKDVLDPKWVETITSVFDQNGKTQADIVTGFTEENSYWSQWDNEEAYNEWYAWNENEKRLLNLDVDAETKKADSLQAVIDTYDDLNKQLKSLNRWGNDDDYVMGELEAEKHQQAVAMLNNRIAELGKQFGKETLDDDYIGFLKNEVAKIRQDTTNATYKQKGERLKNEALSAPDFETKNQYGTTTPEGVENVKAYMFLHPELTMNNVITDPNHEWYGGGTLFEPGHDFYEAMTEEEKKILGYYLAHDVKKAEEYIKALTDTASVGGRVGAMYQEKADDWYDKVLFSLAAGTDQFSSGLKGVGNAISGVEEYIPTSPIQVGSSMIRQDIEEGEGFWNDVLGITYDLGTTTANMLPSILVGTFNPTAGVALMGASAGGNAYNEMINLGYDKNQARAYGVMVGASEALLERALGGFGAFGGGGGIGGAIANKFLSKVDNAFARVAIKTGGGMISEFTEESLQTILEPWFESIVTGADYDAPEIDEVLYSGLLGALSAGFLEGGSNTINAGVTTYRGSKVKKADGAIEKLKKLGTSFSADSVASQLAGRVTNESGAYTIGRLFQEVGATLSAQNKSDIIIGLTKRGVDESSAKKIANTYEAFLNGEMQLTDEQVKTLEGLDPLNDVLKKNIIGVNTDVYQRTREYSDILNLISNKETKTDTPSAPEVEAPKAPQTFAPYSKEHIDSMAKEFEAMGLPIAEAQALAQSNLFAPDQGNPSPKEENAVQSQYEVSADGKTINTKNGEIANIKNIESISENGEANLTLDDGMVVKASDLSYGTEAEGIIIGNIGAIKIGKNPISTTSANALYMTAMSALESNPNMTADEAMSLIKGLEESYIYGTYNFGESKLTATDEYGSARLYAGELSQAQRKYAYELGTKDAVNKVEADQKVIDDLKAKAEGKTPKKTLGKVIFEKGANIDESALTDTQRANLNGIKLLAEISSVEFHVFRSDKNNKFKYTMPDGTVTTANGWFVAGTNQIWIDLNAGNAGEGTMVRTAAHEISHYIKQWSPQKWRAMADMLMEEFAKNGVDTESMLNKQIAKIKRRYKKKNMPSESKLLDMAYEELVCDALSDMLTDGSIVNFIAEVKAKDASLGKKIINAIKNLLKKWGLIIDSYKGRSLDTAEAQALSQLEDTFKKLQELYRDAFMDANETVALIAEGGDVTGDTDIDGAEGDHLLSDRSMVEGAGLRFIPTKKDGKRVLEYRVEDADGNAVTEVDKEMIKDSPLGNLVTAAVEGGYISKADAEVQYEFLADLVNMCLQYKGIAPVWETAGTLVFSAIKNNADKQYGKTIDFSTVCKKTQAIVDAMSEAMLRLGRGLTRAEVETIYLEVGKAGEETPCPVCYVFSRWMGIGGILDQMSRFQNKYVPMKDADIRAFMEDIEDRIDKRANTPNKKGELKADFFDKDGNIKQGQVIADLKNKAGSKAASALKALSKNSDIKLQIQELEALAKTQDAKGKKATEKKITSLKKKLVDVSETETIMKSANDEVELYEAYQWLTRTLMVKDANDNWVRNKDFKSVPIEVLFDLNKGDEFASGYPLSWAFRTGKGASAGKAILPYADARVGETIQGIAKSDIKDIKVGLDLNPFLNGDKQTQKKLLETARIKQLRQNLIGGQRYQSTSDFRYEYGSDYLITFLEMQAIGAKVQLYTKVIEAVDFLATVGAECNLSVMPLSDGFITLEDGTKKLVYSSVTGINGKAAIEKTHQYDNVQLILVGISDEHIRLALEGDEVTFVIPFHGSGNSVHQIQALMNLLGENLDVTTAQDYTSVQSDHHLKEKTQAQKDAWELRKKIIMGKAGTLTAAEHRILKENAFLDDMYRRFYEDESAEEYGVALTEDQANQIFPYEYWDKSLTYDQADQNGERFKQYCETLGIVPRFSGVDSGGKNVGFGDFTNAKGYWKLLIDRRMYENVYDENGNWVGYGKYHHPKTIDVTNFKAETIDPEWGTAHYGEVMAKSNDPKKTNKIVAAAIAQFENKGEIKPSERDLAPTFYSQMGKVVEGVKQEKLAANSVVNLLRGKGVKAEEIRWSGIVPFLEGKKSVTKQELLDFINRSMLQIGEQMSNEEGARWSQYKLDGGTNYRELVFTLPNNTYSNQMMRTHWGQDAEGVLVHARIQDFNVKGKKMLFIEELQSDYHNEGHQSGYQTVETDAKIDELKTIAEEKYFALEDYSTELTGYAGEWEAVEKTDKGAKLLRAYREAQDAYDNAMNEYVKKIPDAPFKGNYHEFVLKRLLRMAAEQGYDSIGWTPSEIQSERWSDEFAEGYRIEYDQEMPKFLKKYGRQWGAKVGKTAIAKETVEGRERLLKETELANVKRDIESAKRELARHYDSYEKAVIQRSIDSMEKTVATLEKELSASLSVWSMDIPDSMKDSVLYEGQVMYSERVTDEKTLDFLNEQIDNGEYITVYRSFQVIDGGLYAPMNAMDRDENGKNKKLGYRSEIGQWEKATESRAIAQRYMDTHPDAPYAKFDLDGGDNKTGGVAYNPYLHASNLVLNDQFAAAYRRNLVTVECRVPLSEAEGAYKADYAKDGTGWANWKAGGVAGQLKKIKPEFERRLFLSRYMLPVKILSDAEVAQMYKDYLDGTDISVPWNVVTPSLRKELEKVGVKISYKDVKRSNGPLKFEEQFPEEVSKVLYSERDTSSSNRAILANALESVAQNDIERNKLAQYKEKISLIEAEEQRLSEIQKKLFTKGAVEPTERKDLQFEAKQISNRINTYDRQLLNLESTTALKNVLNREKALAMKRQKQKDNEYLKQYKEKVAKDKKVLLERNQESRKKAIEGRERTAMRHKIKTVVNDLNNLLLKPSKERHVPEEMRIAVAEALAIVNMDTVDADTRVAHYNDLIAKATDPDVIASLTETRDRILNQGNKLADKLTKLKDAYSMVRDSADESLRGIYDDVIYSRIESVQKVVGKTPLRNMTLGQLESVYDLYKMVLTTIRDSNKAFAENITMTRLALGSNTFAEIKNGNKARDTIKHQHLEKFLWQNLKPMQAMKTIGSGTLQKLWNNILYGQEVFAVDYDEAVKFAKEMKDKHGYEKWNKDKLYSFDSKSGKTMKLTLEQMMSIYAYSKRAQADEHIEYGGIVLNEGVIKVKNKLGKTVEVKVNDSTAYRLDKMQVASIVATLEKVAPGAKAFVDEMQKYLSETMGAKGNEVSMKMYGIKLFKEEHYFPLKSSKDFMEAANAKLKGDVKIKNKGMTKSTVEHARNPIVLENFLDVWGNHVNEMAMYHGLVLPLEDFSRTLNYSFKADDQLNTDAESVRTALHDAFGDNADNYLNELLKAINGGVLHDSSAQFADRMISKFKKSKVMASLSVIVQQPTAIIRAMGIIEPKYFVAQNFNHKATWEELKKYCPTAIIKETGSFDTNMGRTIVDMIKDERGFTDKVGDVLGKAPAFMDEMGWNMIWRALKKKVATEQNLSGEALLQECGKQMTLIINETQVYDSVMSRNELMRSKSAFTKMATAFMGEPTTVANMIYGAGLDFKRGKKGVAGKTVAATITSVVINGLVSAIVYAMRDDDEEKTFLEKYLSSATTEVVDGLNPLTYIPFVKDAYSLFQGYKVERTDMALIKDVVDAIDDFYNVLDPEEYEGMSEKETAKHIYENSVPLLTAICDMFGLPVGNVLRDAEAIIVQDNAPMSQTSSMGTWGAFKEGILSSLPQIVSKFIGTESKQDQLYDAIVSGDTAYIERLKSGYKDEASYETAVRKALRENDERIKEAAEAYNDGDIRERDRILAEIVAEGYFDEELIAEAIDAETNSLDTDSSEETETEEEEKATSIYKADDVNVALESGDKELALEIIDDLVKTKVENGMEEDKARSSVKSSVTSHWKPLYKAAYQNKDSEEMKRIRKLLLDSGLYGRASQVSEACRDWIKELAKEKNK